VTDPAIGICLAAFADRSFDAALEAAAGLDLSVIDLPTDSVFALSRSRPADTHVRDRLADLGLRVACVSNSRDAQLLLGPHGPHTDGVVAGSARAKVEHARRAARDAIRLAGVVGAPAVRLMLGCPDYGRWLRWSGTDVGWDDNVAAFVDVAAPLAREAEGIGVQLCIEPHVKQVAFDAPSVLACLDGVRAAGGELGICFDPANVAALGFDPVAFLAAIDSVPVCVHAKDLERSTGPVPPPGPGWVRYGPQPAVRFRCVPWGELDWARILSHLQEIGFGGPVLIEHEDLLIDRERGIDGARRFLESHRMGRQPGSPWW
jgi:sugar phosphate isomerase/epimerase